MEVNRQPDHLIQFRPEEWRMELKNLQKIKLLSLEDCGTVEKKRIQFEKKISKIQAKEDFLNYIQFELNLFSIIRARRNVFDNDDDIDIIDIPFVQRVIKLFQDVVLKYKDDVKLWMHYFKLCKQLHLHGSVKEMLRVMLNYHGYDEYLWKFASDFAMDQLKDFLQARQYLKDGLKTNPKSLLLHTEEFRLELEFVRRKNFELEIRKLKTDERTDRILKGDRALSIYYCSMKELDDVEFLARCLNVAKQYQMQHIEDKIFADMEKYYPDKERTWDETAKRVYEGRISSKESTNMEIGIEKEIENNSLIGRINASVELYKEAIQKNNTTLMWSLYLDHLIQLDNEEELLPKLKRKLLTTGLENALVSNHMEERYFLKYQSILEDFERIEQKSKAKKIEQILEKGTSKYPKSFILWEKRLIHAMKKNGKVAASLIFQSAMTNLEACYKPKTCLKLYVYMIMFYQSKDNKLVKRLFEKGISHKTEISQLLKPMYVEWLTIMEGIMTARRVFLREDIFEPPRLELFQKMMSLESIQPDTSLSVIRKCHELATKHFGKTNPNIWFDYIKFELKFGEPSKVDEIKKAALNDLIQNQLDLNLDKNAI